MTAIAKQPNRPNLKRLAVQINKEHDRCSQHAKQTLEAALRCGDLLAKAKSQLKHGEWIPWLEKNFHGTRKTASVYLSLAKNRRLIEGQMGTESHLPKTINGAKQILLVSQKTEGEAKSVVVQVEVTKGEPPAKSIQIFGGPRIEAAAKAAKQDILAHAPALAAITGRKLPKFKTDGLKIAMTILVDKLNRAKLYDHLSAKSFSEVRRYIEGL